MVLREFNIIFYKGNSLISKLIKFISKSKKYSHVALMLNEWHSLESAWNNPCVISHFNYKKCDYAIYELRVNLSENDKIKIKKYIFDNLNSGYDYLYLISRGLNFIFNTPVINSKKTLTCDELVVEAFKSIGIILVDDDIKLSPENLSKSKLLRKVNFR